MEINKRLILNKTPKDMPYGAISCAKNMMVDDTGSFLTNDIGFKVGFSCTKEREVIVGVIPCNEEIVIFTYQPASQGASAQSHIYRKKDGQSAVEVGTVGNRVNWQHTPGTKITGSFTYNYKGELIIAFSEYKDDNSVSIPLKSLNLDSFNSNLSYSIEEEVPTYDSGSYIATNGSLVCGVYTFFVRFKVDKNNYTKWFQVTGDVNITQVALSKKYVHKYLTEATETATIQSTTGGSFNVNANKTSNKSIVVSLTFPPTNISALQLGYIVKRHSEVLGRLQGEYAIPSPASGQSTATLNITVSNNKYLEEISVDSFLENPHQFFNVKNIINYNNRLYIANYKEYPVVDYSANAAKIVPTINGNGVTPSTPDNPQNNNNTKKVYTFALYVLQHEYVDHTGWEENENVSYINIVTDKDGYLTDPKSFISDLATHLYHKPPYGTPVLWGDNGANYYLFLQHYVSPTPSGGTPSNSKDNVICIASSIGNEDYAIPPGWGWNFEVPDYKAKVVESTPNTYNIVIEYNNKSWVLTNGSGSSDRVAIVYYFKRADGDIAGDLYGFGNNWEHDRTPEPTSMPVEYVNTDDPAAYLASEGGVIPHDIHISITSIESSSVASYDNPDVGTSDVSGGEGVSPTTGANNRTLRPYQKYRFFVHYIRKDGSVTPGFEIPNSSLPGQTDSWTVASGSTVIIPKFRGNATNFNPNPNEFVGYFISYEDVESTVDSVYITRHQDSILFFTNAEYLYDIDTIRGNTININGTNITIDQTALSYIESRLTYNHLELKGISGSYAEKVAYVIKNLVNIYTNKVKTLYRLTKNIYDFNTAIGTQEYLPGFYTSEVIIQYIDAKQGNIAQGFVMDPSSTYVIGFNTISANDLGKPTVYKVDIKPVAMYSSLPLSAMSIKQDYQQAAVTFHTKKTTQVGKQVNVDDLYVNCFVSPDRLHDLLELEACYSAKPSKSYTNFNPNNTDIFDKTIYRSDVVSDESLVNAFRHFAANNYKNIFENKGKIINIVGIGLYFIVHTEYSIYVFDRTPKLTMKSQLDIPDVFDIDYQDIMPSNEGFGGLADKEESIITKHGYIWYDRVNKYIFNYENGKVTILSADINNFLKYINVTKVRFAEDIKNNRLLICIYTSVEVLVEEVSTTVTQIITLSYSFNTKSFISLHDYKFTNNYKTYNTSYLFDENTPIELYEFDNTKIVDYPLALRINHDYYFPYYTVRVSDPASVTAKSYIDIIFNNEYYASKAVESIKYLLSAISSPVNVYKITEEQLNRKFSGYEIKLYSDETDSGELDIKVDETNVNGLNNYKLPYFDKGSWNLNYFRNRITEIVNEAELNDSKTFKEYDPNTGIYADKDVPLDKLKEANRYLSVPDRADSSDMRSLIYGKYIVVRFIFANDTKVKLDGVDIITTKY